MYYLYDAVSFDRICADDAQISPEEYARLCWEAWDSLDGEIYVHGQRVSSFPGGPPRDPQKGVQNGTK